MRIKKCFGVCPNFIKFTHNKMCHMIRLSLLLHNGCSTFQKKVNPSDKIFVLGQLIFGQFDIRSIPNRWTMFNFCEKEKNAAVRGLENGRNCLVPASLHTPSSQSGLWIWTRILKEVDPVSSPGFQKWSDPYPS